MTYIVVESNDRDQSLPLVHIFRGRRKGVGARRAAHAFAKRSSNDAVVYRIDSSLVPVAVPDVGADE